MCKMPSSKPSYLYTIIVDNLTSNMALKTRKHFQASSYRILNCQNYLDAMPPSHPDYSCNARGQSKQCTATLTNSPVRWGSNKSGASAHCLSFNLQSSSFSSSCNKPIFWATYLDATTSFKALALLLRSWMRHRHWMWWLDTHRYYLHVHHNRLMNSQ